MGEIEKAKKNTDRDMGVLKCRVYSGIVGPMAHEMTTVGKTVCYSQLPRGRGMPHYGGSLGEAQGWV